ncbi:helix-turn-helix domain-containing protein [Pseudomonas sp. 2822-17]|uniref:helix-turn-helix domain-containing protein n=1 Tax=Pseudomonas TaxID=286 RepID=UPI000C15E0B0|nr:helix-turn-helix domain-containing protein [Pseudomonas sp. 2822-17]
MDMYRFSRLLIQSTEIAACHFQAHDNDMEIFPGHGGRLHYQKKACILGKSFVSLTISHTGWGYEMKNETNGFLITIPHAGEFTWRTSVGNYRASAGTLALADVREISASHYAPGITYTTVYIDNSDMFRYLSVLLGTPPKTRVHFDKPNPEVWKSRFIIGLVNTIFDLGENSRAPLEKVASSLKETMVGFVLSNFKNNYSRALDSAAGVAIPTPYEIKKAAEYMIANTDPELTVGEIAIFAGISVRSLQTGFKRYKNMSPIEFLRNERLLKSKELISKGGTLARPQEVACQVGFSNYHVFCKYYMQSFGEHPTVTFQKSKKSLL